jgi:hypothetical protein
MSEVKKTRDIEVKVTREKAIKIYNSLVALNNQVNDAGNPVISSGWIAFSKSMANIEPVDAAYKAFLKPLQEKLKALKPEEGGQDSKKKKVPALTEEVLKAKQKELDDEVEAYLKEEITISVRQLSIDKIKGERHNAFLMTPLWDVILIEED